MNKILAFCLLWNMLQVQGLAARWTLQIGPPGFGAGGTNPISIPPTQFQEYGLIYTSKTGGELSISVIPGVFYSQRWLFGKWVYTSLGGGIGINIQGVGPATSFAMGFDGPCGDSFCFHMEYRTALILTNGILSSAYGLKGGFSFDW